MEQKKRTINWGSIGIIVAILVLAASIFFTGMKVSNTVKVNIQDLRSTIKEEIAEDLRKEVISLIYAFRSSSMANRQISAEDIKKGYQFAQQVLSGMK